MPLLDTHRMLIRGRARGRHRPKGADAPRPTAGHPRASLASAVAGGCWTQHEGITRGCFSFPACVACRSPCGDAAHKHDGCPAYDEYRAVYGASHIRHLHLAGSHPHLPCFTRGWASGGPVVGGSIAFLCRPPLAEALPLPESTLRCGNGAAICTKSRRLRRFGVGGHLLPACCRFLSLQHDRTPLRGGHRLGPGRCRGRVECLPALPPVGHWAAPLLLDREHGHPHRRAAWASLRLCREVQVDSHLQEHRGRYLHGVP